MKAQAVRMYTGGLNMIFENVRNALAQQFEVEPESITMDTNLIDDLGADSLDVVEMTMALEEEFDIPETDDEVLVKLVTVGDVLRYIQSKVEE
jgi:acyl carrier protein